MEEQQVHSHPSPILLVLILLTALSCAWALGTIGQKIAQGPGPLLAQTAGGPTISLSPSRTSGVAPLSVFFDATGTTDPATTGNPFRDLEYRWDFGDPGAGTWRLSGKNKNEAIGGIAGHLFTTPGTYTVRLTVTNANGVSSSQTTTITVDNPDTVFSETKTRCVSTSGNFSGCPAGAEQITIGTGSYTNVANTLLNQAGRRTLYRRGETFSHSSSLNLVNAGATGSTLGAYPVSGTEYARFVTGSARSEFLQGTNWRVMDLHLTGNGMGDSSTGNKVFKTEAGSGISRLTAYNIYAERFNQCLTFSSNNGINTEIAIIDVTCKDFPIPGTGTKFYEDTSNSMFMGVEIDKGRADLAGHDSEFNHRSVQINKKILQHSKYYGRAVGQSKNVLQLRHCGSSHAGGICSEGGSPGRYAIISDNQFIEGGGPQGYVLIRVCDEAGCWNDSNEKGGPEHPAPTSYVNIVEHLIFERNLFQVQFDNPTTEPLQSIFRVQAAKTTIRNNIFDLQQHPRRASANMLIIEGHPPGYFDNNEIWFLNNSIYLGSGFNQSVTLCNNSFATASINNRCQNNLLYAPGLTGSYAQTSGGGWTAGNNLRDGGTGGYSGNPFTSIPAHLSATLFNVGSFFTLPSSSPGVNTGATVPNMRMNDFTGNTVRTGTWDVGAYESGVTTPPPPAQVCNNNVREGTEVCDGTQLNGQSCTTQGFTGGTLSCNASCSGYVTSACTNVVAPVCGNGVIEGTEQCDGANLGGATCVSRGFTGGTLSCSACAFVTSACTNTTGTITTLILTPRIEGATLPAGRSVTISFRNRSTQALSPSYTQTVAANGTVTLTGLSLSSQTRYDVRVSSANTLARIILDQPASSPLLPLLPAGDLNGDRSINSLDWSVMNGQWGATSGVSDINRDGTVNSIDFSFLNKNWMLASE